ncbi:hypothetical protein [Streptomyces sp. NBC_00878]|uniref:hypothetical protein n=1 Tax=Streptomyces sp. NBC_00878 TaxID=2975854 RepID=UPI00224CA997|nr:hypothetical protein [Streptomyces sp. NBC_00878]MCX4906263.1 hypothetical protein [Streptomyces sp. NBC_00878]
MVLPAPEGPTIAVCPRGGTARSTPRRTGSRPGPYDAVTPFNSSTASLVRRWPDGSADACGAGSSVSAASWSTARIRSAAAIPDCSAVRSCDSSVIGSMSPKA